MRVLLKFFNAFEILSFLLHEIFHCLMALLLFPFDSGVSGLRIVGGKGGNNKWILDGSVYTYSHNRIGLFLIAAAPIIFYVAIWTFLINTWWFVLWGMFSPICKLSDIDVDNIKAALLNRKCKNIISNEDLSIQLNSCLSHNLNKETTVQVSDTTISN